MLAVDLEIAIECDDRTAVMQFSHPHQASIGEGYRYVPVFLHQDRNRSDLISQTEEDPQNLPFQQFKNGGNAFVRAPEEKARLGDDCFAGQQGWLNYCPLGLHPIVVVVPRIKEGDQRTRIQDDLPFYFP